VTVAGTALGRLSRAIRVDLRAHLGESARAKLDATVAAVVARDARAGAAVDVGAKITVERCASASD